MPDHIIVLANATLDYAKQRLGIITDRELATALNRRAATISDWRHGRSLGPFAVLGPITCEMCHAQTQTQPEPTQAT